MESVGRTATESSIRFRRRVSTEYHLLNDVVKPHKAIPSRRISSAVVD
jgi:hypothetical protein